MTRHFTKEKLTWAARYILLLIIVAIAGFVTEISMWDPNTKKFSVDYCEDSTVTNEKRLKSFV
jgi:hypothetical protein